jgi:predicted DNA-binding transcriptional regulator YafY
MSATKSRNTIARQWEILKMLPSRPPGMTKRQLSDLLNNNGFEVGGRTVERDLNELSAIFPIACNDKGVPYGWHWAKDAALDLPGVSAAEALSLCLVERVIDPLLPASVMEVMQARFAQAKKKLDNLAAESVLQDWADKVANVSPSLEQLAPAIQPEVFETLQNALLHGEQVAVDYHAMKGNTKKHYTLNPLGLVQRGVFTYIVGCVDPHSDIRLFAVHRMSEAERLTTPVSKPDDFSLQQYIDDGGLHFTSGKTLLLVARVREGTARVLTESPLSHDQVLTEKAEGFELRASVTDSWQLKWWIMSQGDNIEVTAPSALRQEIENELSKALAQYQKAPDE